MHIRLRISIFVGALAALVTGARASSTDIGSVPPTVFVLAAQREDGAVDLYSVTRDKTETMVVFSRSEDAVAFCSKLVDTGGRSYSATAWQRSYVEMMLKSGRSVILDPLDHDNGGRWVVMGTSDSDELKRMMEEDQADRTPKAGEDIDWDAVMPRDRLRRDRAIHIYEANELRTGADYFRAALILHHSPVPEDILLAHELSIVSLVKGYEPAKWLAAATEDRFLMFIGRKQRFGTQLTNPLEIEPGVTDNLRASLGVPTVEETKEKLKAAQPGATDNPGDAQ